MELATTLLKGNPQIHRLRKHRLRFKVGHAVRVRGGTQLHVQPQSFPSPLLQVLHLGAREWNGRARRIHGMSELVTPDSSREKKRTLLQFLSDHFQDIQTLSKKKM